jgi:hypothetical protein
LQWALASFGFGRTRSPRAEFTICAVKILPVLQEEIAKGIMCFGKLWVELDLQPKLALCAIDILSLLHEGTSGVNMCVVTLGFELDRRPELALCAIDILPVLQEEIVKAATGAGILRIGFDRRPELALCAIDIIPVLQEEIAKAVTDAGILQIGFDRRPPGTRALRHRHPACPAGGGCQGFCVLDHILWVVLNCQLVLAMYTADVCPACVVLVDNAKIEVHPSQHAAGRSLSLHGTRVLAHCTVNVLGVIRKESGKFYVCFQVIWVGSDRRPVLACSTL